ncbi:DMP19 family protein [Prosthecobacter vanneervenii]|uniref:DNA mimic protein DMP19 C-terminal domain-containing protein n=1 Tax=Prosthecobacter vanneervenii TaxID=48466 RepID=A0A7W8DMN4_9BACT|nr:hypothetical protein [Prosthecobacter vanneervenii]MBB5035659.1 hypothetical protein [Prosthecobacter vanneervenii]
MNDGYCAFVNNNLPSPSYDIDELLDIGTKDPNRAILVELHGHLEGCQLLPVEQAVFALWDLVSGTGNDGFDGYLYAGDDRGFEGLYRATDAAKVVGAELSLKLLLEVEGIFEKAGLTRKRARELGVNSLDECQDYPEGRAVEEMLENDGIDSSSRGLFSRWNDLSFSEVHPLLLAYLEANRELLRCRK